MIFSIARHAYPVLKNHETSRGQEIGQTSYFTLEHGHISNSEVVDM